MASARVRSWRLVHGQAVVDVVPIVQRNVGRLTARLPTDIQPPTVNRADPNAFPVMNVALSGKRPVAPDTARRMRLAAGG